jgi:hypothetical protein
MRKPRASVVLLMVVVASATRADERKPASPKRPVLTLRATPGSSMPPANVVLVAELVGGDDVEELYCPEIEWDFDNGRRSSSQEDCEPFSHGTRLERRFLVRQRYASPGDYLVTVTLRRADRVVAQAAATVQVVSPGTEGGGPFAAARR